METTRALAAIGTLCALLLLSGCGGKPGIEELSQPISSAPFGRDVLDSSRFSEPSHNALRASGLERLAQSDPAAAIRRISAEVEAEESIILRVAGAELAVTTARRLREEDPRSSLGYFLCAVELARPAVILEKSTERELLRVVYNQASAELAAVLREVKGPGPGSWEARGPLGNFQLGWRGPGPGLLDPADFETLRPASLLRVKGFDARNRRHGYGGALVGFQAATEERLNANPFMPYIGFAVPVTAVARRSAAGRYLLELHDVIESEHIRHDGRNYPLAADFTAAVATLESAGPGGNAGFEGMFRPEDTSDKEGLYLLAPYRSDRIPLVLVHGLMSKPSTWREVINSVYGDPVLRRKYQVLVYFYPTGYPIAKNATELRRDLKAFRERFDTSNTNPRMKRMVMVGHSMGGILTNAQIRKGGDKLWGRVFAESLEEVELSEPELKAAKEVLYFDANPDIKRVIFICAPHRGSPVASRPLGRLGSRLISYPFRIFDIASESLMGEGTEFAQTFVKKPTSSIDDLKPDARVLEAILGLPMAYSPPYHSIIGNRGRGGELENSSDGVVPYWSSQLEGAVSEKIVPTGHSATNHPETVEEVKRILYLHLGTTYRGASN